MQKRGFLRLVLAAFLCLTLHAAAATPAKTLPAGVEAHISIQSVGKMKRNLFRLIDASTKRTKNHVPVEFLEVMSQMAVPVPLDIWKSDEPTHAVFVRNGGQTNLVMVFSVDSFQDFVGNLEEAEWAFGETDTSGGYETVLPVVLPNGKSMLMVDLGEGVVALADLLADVAVVMDDANWKPAHESTADLCANIAVNGGMTIGDNFLNAMERTFDKLLQAADEAGLTREASEGLLTLAKKYIPRLGAELDKATNLLIELSFENDRLIADVGVRFADGAYMKSVMEHMEKQPMAASGRTGAVPGSPLSVAVNAPMENFLPDPDKVFSTLLDDFLEQFPSHGQEMRDSYRRTREAGIGATVTANYLINGKQIQYTIVEARDVQAGYEGMVANINAFGKTLTGFFADPDESVELIGESHSRDGFAWHTFAPVPKNAEKFEKVLDRLNEMNRNLTMTMQFDADLRIHVAALADPSSLIVAVGAIDADGFLSLLRETGKAGTDWFAAPGAEKVLDDVKGSQFARALVSPDGAFLLFGAQIAHEESRRQAAGAPNASMGVLEHMAGQMEKKDAYMAIGGGAGDGWLQFRLSVPAAAVNTIVLDYEKFQSFLRTGIPQPTAPEAEETDAESEEIVLEKDDEAA